MSEAEQPPANSKRPQERSPSFPYIGLTKAVERATMLYNYAKRHDIRMIDAAKPVWDMGPKSSSTLQTVAALSAFALIESTGTGDSRKIRLSDVGYRIVADPRPGAKDQGLREVALKPKAIAELREHWGPERPADVIAMADLTVDRGFTDDGAKAFLRVYDDTIAYADDTNFDKEADNDGGEAGDVEIPRIPVAVGDLVQAAPGGILAFEKVRVRAIQEHEGQSYVFVEGSETGCAMSDVTLLERAAAPVAAPPTLPLSGGEAKAAPGEGMDRFTVDEGVVKITFPESMSGDSLEDLEAFFALFIKKAKRRAGSA